MQLVVEISEDTFFDLKKKQNRTEVDNAVLNGTPLPKGHGRLIDADNIHFSCGYNGDCTANNCSGCSDRALYIDGLRDEPTIVEADKLESEE